LQQSVVADIAAPQRITIGDLTVDLFQPKEGPAKAAMIMAHDAFGFDPATNIRVACTRFAAAGYVVALPDFYAGASASTLPEGKGIGEWLKETANYDITKPKIAAVAGYLRDTVKVQNIGFLGFCWGGGMAVLVGADAKELGISASGGLHAAVGLAGEDYLGIVEKTQAPLFFIQAKNDPDARPLAEAVEKNEPFGAGSEVRTFYDQLHGFCAARGDWSQPKIKRAAHHAVSIAIGFFGDHVKVV